ncbi:hypothetical protein [Pseudotamlana carrageenivorans]|uniref:Uncharacterized protein n=1 Tax=Pseudotamlana carrageenivorans TaxID=2069432 RepID=A0A2I7SEQ6_9FLAO|nr:hypothetical protein [Tamlana carrageenivorans]AUS04393.1 hypothetical protein C1A40_02400 [Tamlana carrageenivorans]
MIKKIKDIIVVALIVLISFGAYMGVNNILKRASDYQKSKTKTEYKTEYKTHFVDSLLVVVDSLTVQVDSLNGKENQIIYVPQDVDTVFIIKQYYSRIKQSVKHRDSNLYVNFNFDLHKNRVELPKLEYKILKPTTLIKQVPRVRNQYFLGASFGSSINGIDAITPEIMLVKETHALKLGYNLLDKDLNFHLGYYFKIR